MKPSLLALVLSLLVLSAHAQETVKQKEAGLAFRNFDNFGLVYRTGTSTALWRFSGTFLNGGSTTQEYTYQGQQNDVKNDQFNFQITIGREFRKKIDEKFTFRYGADLVAGYSSYQQVSIINLTPFATATQESNSTSVGFDIVIGTNYALSENVLIGIELLPYFTYSTGSVDESITNGNGSSRDVSGTSYGFNSTSAMLSLVYKW